MGGRTNGRDVGCAYSRRVLQEKVCDQIALYLHRQSVEAVNGGDKVLETRVSTHDPSLRDGAAALVYDRAHPPGVAAQPFNKELPVDPVPSSVQSPPLKARAPLLFRYSRHSPTAGGEPK